MEWLKTLTAVRTRCALVLGVLVGVQGAMAQPKDGDVVFTALDAFQTKTGVLAYFDPNQRTLATISSAVYNWVRMGAYNTDLVVSELQVPQISFPWSATVQKVTPGGTKSSLTPRLGDSIDGFELDYDGQWIANVQDFVGVSSQVVRIDDTTGAVTTIATIPQAATFGFAFQDVAIDRDPGGPDLVVAVYRTTVDLLAVDASARFSTVSAAVPYDNWSVELHPRSGDYLVGTSSGSLGGPMFRVTKAGAVKTLSVPSLGFTQSLRIDQRDVAWLATTTAQSSQFNLIQYDVRADVTLSTSPINMGQPGVPTGLEIYGWRSLMCRGSGRPGTPVLVRVQSRRPGAANQRYRLAASLARRPGLRMPNGEWLDLAPDGLFTVSVFNLAPQVFQRFSGTLDPNGIAQAQVSIPANFPPGSGVTVFVAGIVLDNAGQVLQVTNTHWFVLT